MRQFFISRYAIGVVRVLASALQRFRAWFSGVRWLPTDLAGSWLVFAEKTFSIDHPIRLIVRVDRVYYDGTAMILLELKTRFAETVYASDIIELSAQRLAVQYQTRAQAYDFAFVLLQHPLTHRRVLRKVSLLSEHEILDIDNRRRLLMLGTLKPRHAINSECCRRCEYRQECRPTEPSIGISHRRGATKK